MTLETAVPTIQVGVDKVVTEIDKHQEWLITSKQLQVHNHSALVSRVEDLVDSEVRAQLWGDDAVEQRLQRGLQEIAAGQSTPYRLAAALLQTYRQRVMQSETAGNHPAK